MPFPRQKAGDIATPLFQALLIGLIVAQLIGTAQVYWSNLQVFRGAVALSDAGYLSIPTTRLLGALRAFWPAVFGGLFYTLTVGAGLSLATAALLWLWRLAFRSSRWLLPVFAISWLALLAAGNRDGFNLFANLYFLLVPASVALVYLRRMPPAAAGRNILVRLLPMYPLAFLAILWSTQADSHLFTNIRDSILMSNPVGMRINDFYYRYTLYAAEAFKSLEQKTLRICNLDALRGREDFEPLESRFRRQDYLAVKAADSADLTVREEIGQLVFIREGQKILQIEPQAFLSGPSAALREYSRRTDSNRFFRAFTFYSILFAFPILLYCGVYGSLRCVSGLILEPRASKALSATLCFLIGASLLVPVALGTVPKVTRDNLGAALASSQPAERITALKFAAGEHLDIGTYPTYRPAGENAQPLERYWTAHALAFSRDPRTIAVLRRLLADPHPNVVCQALYALGQRRATETAEEILTTIETADEWYVQRYGYAALRSLGWTQPQSE